MSRMLLKTCAVGKPSTAYILPCRGSIPQPHPVQRHQAALLPQGQTFNAFIGPKLLRHRRSFTTTKHCVQAAAAADLGTAPESSIPSSTPNKSKNDAVRLAFEVLWPDRYLVAVTAITLLITIGLTLAFPLAIGDLFDVVREHLATSQPLAGPTASGAAAGGLAQMVADVQGVVKNAPSNFYKVLFRLCACLGLSATGNAAVAYLAPLLGERFAVRMRKRLMTETVSKDQGFFDSAGKGDITARLTLDIAVVQATVADFLGQRGIRSMLEVLCSLLIISIKNPLLAIVSFVVTPALSALLRRVVAKSAQLTYLRQQAAAAAMEFATERLTHVRTVQLFAAEDREASAYSNLTQEGYSMARRCATFQGIVEGAGRLAVNVGTLSLLGLGGALVLAGRISLGTLLAFNVYNLFLSVGLSALAGSLGEMGKAAGAMERIAEVVGAGGRDPAAYLLNDNNNEKDNNGTKNDASTSSSSTSASTLPVQSDTSVVSDGGSSIELRDVWFKYLGRNDWALQGMTLKIKPGSTLALVGPSGGGKSTTAALLLGLYSPQRGSVLIDGIELNSNTIPEARTKIGTVLQQPSLMAGTIEEQIAMGRPDATPAEVAAAARAAHAAGFIEGLPEGYQTELGERGHQLSGGQQQRLSIARALVRRPKLLLLDEPSAALDVDAELAVDESLQEVKGCTKVIIAHRLSTVRRADVIAVIVGGRVVEQGSHDELMAMNGGHYQRMVQNSELGGSGNGFDAVVEEERAHAV